MGFLDHQGESEFPFAKETVFNAMVRAIPMVSGMKIENADKLQGRIVVKAGVSLMSWGENIPILLSEITENRTRVSITSTPKTGVMFGGAFDLGKNRKNIEQILSATSNILSNPQQQYSTNIKATPIPTTPTPTSNTNTSQEPINSEQNQRIETKPLDKKWYDNKFVTHLLLILFFPVGLYALWKSRTIAKWWKITATIIIALIVIANLGGGDSTNANSKSNSFSNNDNNLSNEKSEPKVEITKAQEDSITEIENIKNNQIEQAKSEKQQIIVKLKEKAKRDWPNDYSTQEYWINEQIKAYEYMLTIENNSIKKQAQRDWPLDFSTQKYWYNEQIEARERIK